MAAKKGPASITKSHKAFQPVLPCGNKLLQQKWDQTYYNQHKKLVKAAKPMVDSSAPPTRPHVTSKLKKQQVEKERSDEIDRDNMNLLKKMQRIMRTEGNVDHRNTYSHHSYSLSEDQRKREMERVARENKQMLKRLEKVKPMYKVSEWVDDWERKEQLTGMITNYPEIPVAKKISDTGKDKEVSTTEHHVQVEDSPPVVNSKGQSADPQTTNTSQQET